MNQAQAQTQSSVQAQALEMRDRLMEINERFVPRGGWLGLFLVLGSVAVVAWSVEAADWVETPSLVAMSMWAVLLGYAASKAPGPGILKHVGALVIGGALVYWRTATLAEAQGWPEMFVELNERLKLWWDAAIGGGISSDTVPFALGLGGLTWLVGYVSCWGVLQRRNLWIGVIPGTLALTTNLSYLPDNFLGYFFLYLVLVMLLAVSMQTLGQERGWRRQGVHFSHFYGLSVFHGAAWFIGGVVLLGVLLPVRPVVASDFKDAWNALRWPAVQAEGEFARLFSALPARKPLRARNFGPYLPFQGAISLGDQAVFFVTAPEPAYWRSRVYPVYTSQGWKTDDAETYRLGQFPAMSVERDEQASTEVGYGVSLPTGSGPIPINALPLDMSVPADVEVKASPRYWLPLDSSSEIAADVPEDLRMAFFRLVRAQFNLGRTPVSTDTLLESLSGDTLIEVLRFEDDRGSQRNVRVDAKSWEELSGALNTAFDRGNGRLVGLQIRRAPPSPPDILAVRSIRNIEDGIEYTATSLVPPAPTEQLQNAGTFYPGWVTDTYLQLPDNLPQRVRDMAEEVTAGAQTPYEKAMAIQEHLRQFAYDQKIDPPPFNADGIDYFLFESKRGYSEYFGSAMTVMLRSTGVPARLVAGHSSGVLDEASGQWVVRDMDSHAWSEAYFPGYGWVEFEPTPGFILPATATAADDIAALGGGDFLEDEEDEEDLLDFPAGNFGIGEQGGSILDNSAALGALGALLALVLGAAGAWYVYWRILVRTPGPFGAFEGMCRLAALAGVGPAGSHTPREFCSHLATLYPVVGADVLVLGDVYSRVRYGVQKELEPASQEFGRIGRAWRQVRRFLFFRAIRRYAFFWRTAE